MMLYSPFTDRQEEFPASKLFVFMDGANAVPDSVTPRAVTTVATVFRRRYLPGLRQRPWITRVHSLSRQTF
jgi:hypothetical protein